MLISLINQIPLYFNMNFKVLRKMQNNTFNFKKHDPETVKF